MSSASYLIEHWRDEASRLEAEIDRLEAQTEEAEVEIENLKNDNEDLKTENEVLVRLFEDLAKMVGDSFVPNVNSSTILVEVACRLARVQPGLGAGDRR